MATVSPELREVLRALADGGEFVIVGDTWHPGETWRSGEDWAKGRGVKGGRVYWRTERGARCTRRMVTTLEREGYIAKNQHGIYGITDKGRSALENAS